MLAKLLICCLLFSASFAQLTRIRLIPIGSSIDSYSSLSLNGIEVLENCTLGRFTRYIAVNSGDTEIVYQKYFGSETKIEYFDPATDFTVVIAPAANYGDQFVILEDQYEYSQNPQVRLIHAGYGVPPVNIYLDQALVAPNLAYTQATPYAVVPAGTYVANVTLPSKGNVQALTFSVTLKPNTVYTALVGASLDVEPTPLLFEDYSFY